MHDARQPRGVREVYERLFARGRMEDPGTADVLPELFDPEVHVSQLSTLAGTAGDFHGYAGLVAVAREAVRPLAELEFVPEQMRAAGGQVAVAALVRGLGRSSGVPIEDRVGHLFTLREGRVVRMEVFEDPADAFSAAGLGAPD